MRIVFMGTPDFAVPSLEILKERGHDVALVVTQPDRPRGRSKEPVPGPVKERAVALGIPVIQPESVKRDGTMDVIREAGPELIVVAAFGQILPAELLAIPKHGCVNVHASLLPAYRGAAPIQRAILDGLAETGVTIMQMNEGLDTGDIIAQASEPITETTTGGSLFDALSVLGAKLLADTIPLIEKGDIHPVPQPKESTTPYAGMLTKADGEIDWTSSAEAIERKVRALDPWPSAWTKLDGKILKIWRAHVEKRELTAGAEDAGRIVRQDARGIYIATGEGILVPDEVQLEGRKRMKTADLLRGTVIRNNRLG